MVISCVGQGERPFVSADAAVTDSNEVKIELGHFNLQRSGGENTIGTPPGWTFTGGLTFGVSSPRVSRE